MSLKERYEAAFVLSAVGDALGYKNGKWEFCPSGITIHEEVEKLGGARAIRVDKTNWRVSDDTVLHLATAETLIQNGENKDKNKLYSALARGYQRSMGDMQGRAPGETCMISCAMLEPDKKDGFRIPFNPTGGGCGAAVRSMCIGLRYPDPKDFATLIEMSIEAGRITHNHPTGFLGSLASALFASFAIQGKPIKEWGARLLTALIMAKDYVVQSGHDVGENMQEWDYFQTKWEQYLALRNIKDGTSEPIFPKNFDVNERDIFYRELSFDGQGGASGHDAPMIAYDALLGSGNDWEKLCLRAMFHGGDSDSTGAIAGCLYGAMFGFYGIPDNHYKGLEYLTRLRTVASHILGLVSSRPCDQIGADSLVTNELQQLVLTERFVFIYSAQSVLFKNLSNLYS